MSDQMPLSCPDLSKLNIMFFSHQETLKVSHPSRYFKTKYRVHVLFPPSVQISQNRTKILFFPRQETSVTLAARAEAAQPVNLAAAQTVGDCHDLLLFVMMIRRWISSSLAK